jgi:hypothetical protein
MKLTKIVFRGGVSGIFGESVSSLGTEPSQTGRQVAELELTPLGLVVTTLPTNGQTGRRLVVPLHDLGTGDLAEVETEPAKAPAPRQKAR